VQPQFCSTGAEWCAVFDHRLICWLQSSLGNRYKKWITRGVLCKHTNRSELP